MLVIAAVVFDLDGVLCTYRFERRLELLASWTGRHADVILATIFQSGFEDDAERGLLTADEYLEGYRERLGYPLTAEEWVHARRTAVEPNEEMLALAAQVSEHHVIAMLTNNPFLLQRHFAEVFPAAAALFGDRAIFSAQLGCTKPDPEAFRRLADRLEVATDAILYFDDNEAYVAGARAAGLAAEVAVSADTVRQSLHRHGLLTGPT